MGQEPFQLGRVAKFHDGLALKRPGGVEGSASHVGKVGTKYVCRIAATPMIKKINQGIGPPIQVLDNC